jgi:hypothetical protein
MVMRLDDCSSIVAALERMSDRESKAMPPSRVPEDPPIIGFAGQPPADFSNREAPGSPSCKTAASGPL